MWAERIRQRLKRAADLGVKLAFGTDVIWPDGNKTRGEQMIEFLQAYRDADVGNLKTLQAITSNAAQLIGVFPQRGAVRIGSRADLVAVSANPLEHIDALRAPVMVMKEGDIVVLRGALVP